MGLRLPVWWHLIARLMFMKCSLAAISRALYPAARIELARRDGDFMEFGVYVK